MQPCFAGPASRKDAPFGLGKDAPSALAARIQAILDQPPFASAEWGIHVIDAGNGSVIYSLNSSHLFVPASNGKLLTTTAAFALVGASYRFRTTVETSGSLDDRGQLRGDLVIVGRGDPNLSGRTLPYQSKTERMAPAAWILEEMADQVAQKGLKIVQGDVIGDDTFYSAQRFPNGWAQDDLQWGDGAPVSALSFNDNVLALRIQPGEHAGDKALIEFDPPLAYYEVENRVTTSAEGVPRKIGVHRDPGSSTVYLWGSLPVGSQPVSEAIAIEDPAAYTARLFRLLLEKRGITVTGRAYARHAEIAQFFDQRADQSADQRTDRPLAAPTGTVAAETPAASSQVLAEHISLPLLEDLKVINKTSQNLHAELALRLVARTTGAGGSVEGSVAALKTWLLHVGLQESEFYMQDGSGLSRRDLITPAGMVQLLAHASTQPWAAAFEDTLPVASVDGSLAERFLKSPAAGLVRAKTGTLGHVNALSGYGETLMGRKFIFSIFCNNHNQPPSKVVGAIDAIVTLLVEESSPRKPKAKGNLAANEHE
ncbi:MAG TPA: D-alanyl-D-alanine carboxypeptidase/D-alanyl-D-alanine-endopeptidase [Candidatus Saccharimonadales bacterium]|nr:D-alanyl-D-alanine carboxypeptidase/D-alanyl-D-alanine-endopeptidase [Candidatus Saccharimonadales bacterium]